MSECRMCLGGGYVPTDKGASICEICHGSGVDPVKVWGQGDGTFVENDEFVSRCDLHGCEDWATGYDAEGEWCNAHDTPVKRADTTGQEGT